MTDNRKARPMRRLVTLLLVAAILAFAAVQLDAQPPERTTQLETECFDATANELLQLQRPGNPELDCTPKGGVRGKVGAAPTAPATAVCIPSSCARTIYYSKTVGHIVHWTYPIETTDFYGYKCFKADNPEQPEGHRSPNYYQGIFSAGGQLMRSPAIYLNWCTQNGLVLGGATVQCSDYASPLFHDDSSCNWDITPWNRTTRSVYAHYAFWKGNNTHIRNADLKATMTGNGVLIVEWDWDISP